MVCLLTVRTISRNVRDSHPLVYQAKLPFDFGSRKGVTSREWYGDMVGGPNGLPIWRGVLGAALGYESEGSGQFQSTFSTFDSAWAAQSSMRSSNNPGWNGSSAACSSRKNSALVLPIRRPFCVWQSNA